MAPPFDPGKDPRAGEQWIYRLALSELFARHGLTSADCPEHKMPGPDNYGRPTKHCEWCLKRVMEEALELKEKLPLPRLRELQKALEHYKFHKAGGCGAKPNCKCHFCTRLRHMPDEISDFAVEMALRMKEAAEEEEMKLGPYSGRRTMIDEEVLGPTWDAYNDPSSPEPTSLDDFNEKIIIGYRTRLTKEPTLEIPPPLPKPSIRERIATWFRNLLT